MSNFERDLQRRVSRRQTFRAARGIGLGLLGLAAFGVAADRTIDRVRKGDELTGDQKKAGDLFLSCREENFVRNLVASGEKDGEETIEVKLRNRPETPSDKDDLSYGKVVGDLDADFKVEKAIVVLGNDPKTPFVEDAKGLWYAFPNPKKQDQMVFANEYGFAPTLEKLKVEAFDLSK